MLLFVFFKNLFGFKMGFATVLIAHITFCLPYVILNVLPKLRQMDQSLFEAAMDLGCHPVTAFFKVVIPQIMPGITAGFLMAFTISPHLALFFVGSLPVLAVTLAVMMHIGQPRFRKMLLKMDEMNRAIQENLISSRVVKAFVRGDYESERFAGTVEDLRHAQLSSARLFTLTGPIQMGIMWTCTVLLLLFGGQEIIFGTTGLLTGQLVSLVSYSTQAVSSLTMLSWLLMSLSRAQASMRRINEVFDEEPDIADGPSDAVVRDGSVDFENVSFRYSRKAKRPALQDVNLHIHCGSLNAVIGKVHWCG